MKIKNFNHFINENMDQAKSIISKKMKAFEMLKDLLSKNLGYIGKFTEYLMSENISYEQLESLYKQILDLKSKNVTLDISKLSFEKALDKVQDSYNDLSVNSLISQFPSNQKKIARDSIKNNNYNFNILLKASKKSNIEAFINKVSRYKNPSDLMNALRIFTKDAKNNKENVKQVLSELSSKLVFENDKIMIVYVPKHKDIEILGSDTSWCIVSSTLMWTRYTSGRYQFILYNYELDEFDPLFKIGFTLNPNGSIHAAHDILDSGCSEKLQSVLSENNLQNINLITGLGDIEGAVKKIKVDDVKANTSIASIEILLNSSDKEGVKLLLKRLLRVYGWDKTLGFTKHITESRKNLLIKVIKQYFSGVPYISRANCAEVDDSLYSLVNYYKGNFLNFYDEKKLTWSLPKDILIQLMDSWSDEAIIMGLPWSSDIIKSGYTDYTKPLEDYDFKKGLDATKKLSDRLNKIYKDGTYKKLEDKISLNHFYTALVLLNFLLGRGEISPKELLKYVNKSFYPGLFEKEIDISGQTILGTWTTDYPVESIKKKDYNDAFINIGEWRTFIKFVPRILKHLEGYKLIFRINKGNLRDIMWRNSYGEIKEDNIIYLKKMQDIMKKFPKNLRKGQKVTEGNITIELI